MDDGIDDMTRGEVPLGACLEACQGGAESYLERRRNFVGIECAGNPDGAPCVPCFLRC